MSATYCFADRVSAVVTARVNVGAFLEQQIYEIATTKERCFMNRGEPALLPNQRVCAPFQKEACRRFIPRQQRHLERRVKEAVSGASVNVGPVFEEHLYGSGVARERRKVQRAQPVRMPTRG
jgi:hypothetical protein